MPTPVLERKTRTRPSATDSLHRRRSGAASLQVRKMTRLHLRLAQYSLVPVSRGSAASQKQSQPHIPTNERSGNRVDRSAFVAFEPKPVASSRTRTSNHVRPYLPCFDQNPLQGHLHYLSYSLSFYLFVAKRNKSCVYCVLRTLTSFHILSTVIVVSLRDALSLTRQVAVEVIYS